MDLVDIKDYEGLYSLDKNSNQVYGHKRKKFLKIYFKERYYNIKLTKNSKTKFYIFHRLIFQAYNPDTDISNLQIDHIDGNTKNNNITNLRTATASQNCCNKKIYKNNTSGYKNIFITPYNTYVVQINIDKKKYTKTFKTLDEALIHKKKKLKELHEKYANLG